jgi:hypothetical protein
MSDSYYLSAQVCPNGHVATALLEVGSRHSKFCPDCGYPTLTACACGAPIRGHYVVPHVFNFSDDYSPPAYCHNCGAAFPWTQRRLEAARDLIEDAGDLSADEKLALSSTLDDLLASTPRTEVSAIKFKRLAAKAGTEIAGTLRSVLVDVMSEAARKAIFGA